MKERERDPKHMARTVKKEGEVVITSLGLQRWLEKKRQEQSHAD